MKTKNLIRSIIMGSMTTFALNGYSQNSLDAKPAEEKLPAVQPGSLAMTIKESVTFSILTKALQATGLDLTLGNKGEYTIFAPTDEAFGKLPSGVLSKLLLPENKEKLRSLLLYHVVAGKVLSSDLKDGDVKTLNGEKVKVDVGDKEIEIDEAKVFSADVAANNGVMHTIGTVLIPKSLDGFAGLDK